MVISFPRMFETAVQEMLHIFSQFRVTERKWKSADSRTVNEQTVLLKQPERALGTSSD